jgi:hypothetical protein
MLSGEVRTQSITPKVRTNFEYDEPDLLADLGALASLHIVLFTTPKIVCHREVRKARHGDSAGLLRRPALRVSSQ